MLAARRRNERRASRTAYCFIAAPVNWRELRTGVRVPQIPYLGACCRPRTHARKVLGLLALAFLAEANEKFPFIALLTNQNVYEFDRELENPGGTGPGVKPQHEGSAPYACRSPMLSRGASGDPRCFRRSS